MAYRKEYLCILILPFLCISCLYSRTTGAIPVNKSIRINSGSAILRINGRVNESLYLVNPSAGTVSDVNYDNPLINEGAITKDETKYLSAGEEYKFSVLPTEVVSINIRSLDEDDVEISVFEYGKEKKYTINGTNKMGLFIAFQNR